MSLEELRMVEQQLTAVVSQKQQYQRQILETENALAELEGKSEAYAIVGSVMVKKDASVLVQELTEKKELATTRVQSFEKQEVSLRERIEEVQKSVLGSMSGEEQ